MKLEIKKRGETPQLKKVLIYGEDGSGKSTFAEKYCKENNLTPICIDIDDTNYTNVDYITINQEGDMKTFTNLKHIIKEIATGEEYDTIIFDGVTSELELLTSKANGLKKYADRSERFYYLLRKLQASGKNLIFIGQIDMKVIYTDEYQSPKPIIKINSIVNEKYRTIKEGNNFRVVCEKDRGKETA